ncbi:MAG: DUF2007 domain-containing protein [Prevotellaceae bacterium]|jgi:hypothetical protein|nr:DUF2007 domain-containing protein [Prevotellaceae bacterium]
MEKDWVKVYASANLVEVEMVKQYLEAEGIYAVALNLRDSSYGFGECGLYVHESHKEAATKCITQPTGAYEAE